MKNLAPRDNREKKILVLGDSFSWYVISYLATDVAEIDFMYPWFFNGSISSFVEQERPDAVVLLLNSVNIRPIELD